MSLGEGDPLGREGKRRAPPLQRRYFAAIGLSGVKMLADRHRHAAYHNKHWWRVFSDINIGDIEWPWTPKIGFLVIFYDFWLWFTTKWMKMDQDNLQTRIVIISCMSH